MNNFDIDSPYPPGAIFYSDSGTFHLIVIIIAYLVLIFRRRP